MLTSKNEDGSQPELKYLALGDSYTIGEAVAPDLNWPNQLCQKLGERNIEIAPAQIIATTGWTTDELTAAIDQADPPQDFDLVSLSIGVNNQYRARSVAEFSEQFEQLLLRAIGLAKHRADRVFVVSIPDWGITRFAADNQRSAAQIRQDIDSFNACKANICRKHNVRWIDITPCSRAQSGKSDMFAADGLHPSAEQYRLWMQEIFPVVLNLLH